MSDLHARAEHFIAVVESPARPNERGDVDVLLQEAVNLIRLLDMSARYGGTEMVNKVTETAPERIWLQVSDDDIACDFPFQPLSVEITWSDHSVLGCEVEYVRADLAGSGTTPLTKGQMHQLRRYALHAKREGGYYGSKAACDKRHAAIQAWLDAACAS